MYYLVQPYRNIGPVGYGGPVVSRLSYRSYGCPVVLRPSYRLWLSSRLWLSFVVYGCPLSLTAALSFVAVFYCLRLPSAVR